MALGDILNRDLFRFRSLSQTPGFFERFLAIVTVAGVLTWLGFRLSAEPEASSPPAKEAPSRGEAPANVASADYGLLIAKPISGIWVRGDQVLLEGTLQADGVSVTCNGNRLRVEERYFRDRVLLSEGQNILDITARGPNGIQEQKVLVYRDATPPVVRLHQPTDGATVSQRTVTIVGDIRDAAPARVTVGGRAAPLQNAMFRGSALLEPGENTIEIVAEDRAGNRTTKNVTLTMDTDPPIVVIHFPKDGDVTNADTIEVRGQVDEAVRNEVLINGVPVPVRGKNFEYSLRLPRRDGDLSIVVDAIDAAGNSTQESVRIVRDTQGPELVSWSLEDGRLEGEANEVLSAVRIGRSIARVDGLRFSAPVPTQSESEAAPIEVTLIDLAGNEKKHTAAKD
ncbi:MAG: hypothetical protein RL885_20300 [Planctomycetota bacterium]